MLNNGFAASQSKMMYICPENEQWLTNVCLACSDVTLRIKEVQIHNWSQSCQIMLGWTAERWATGLEPGCNFPRDVCPARTISTRSISWIKNVFQRCEQKLGSNKSCSGTNPCERNVDYVIKIFLNNTALTCNFIIQCQMKQLWALAYFYTQKCGPSQSHLLGQSSVGILMSSSSSWVGSCSRKVLEHTIRSISDGLCLSVSPSLHMPLTSGSPGLIMLDLYESFCTTSLLNPS